MCHSLSLFHNPCSSFLLHQNYLWPISALKQRRKERLCAEAEKIAVWLRESPRLPIPQAIEDSKVKKARRFIKQIKPLKIVDPRITQCQKELKAYQLGIAADTFDHNEGFFDFSVRANLERYLAGYQHSIDVDPTLKKISILVDGKKKEWSSDMAGPLNVPLTPLLQNGPTLFWYYGPKGVQEIDVYHWSYLEPFMIVDPVPWGNRYLFELCVCCKDVPQISSGDHAWIRLRTPKGEVYSVGLYRDTKREGVWKNGFRLQSGYLQQIDISEMWDCRKESIAVEITEETFKKMKAQIEEDKKNEKDLPFHLVRANCLLYAKKIAAIGNIHFKSDHSPFYLLMTTRYPFLKKCQKILPESLVRIAACLFAILFNCVQFVLGGGSIDPKIKKASNRHHIRVIQSLEDLLDPNLSVFHHPHTIGSERKSEVEGWRRSEVDRLQRSGGSREEIEAIAYQLPPTYKA